jgi:hypothetical protein
MIKFFLEKIRYFLAGLLAVGTLVVIAININLAINSSVAESSLSMAKIETMASSETLLPPVYIICDAGSYGRCHYLSAQESYTGACWWKCKNNGDMRSSCYLWQELVMQFCSMYSL